MSVSAGSILARVSRLLLFALFALAPRAHASCGAESCPLDNSAFGGRARRFSLEFSYQYTDQSRVRVGGAPGDLAAAYASGGEVRTISSVSTTKVLCSLGSRWQVSASLPVIDRLHRHVTAEGIPIPELRTWEYSGVGDLTLLGNGSLFTTRSETPLSAAILGGIKLPTGRRHIPAIDGEEPEPHARPGTGSTDLLAGVQMLKVLPLPTPDVGTSVVFASALFTYTGRGVDGYRVGRMFETHLGASYPLLSRLRLLAQVSSRASAKDRSEAVESSGSHAGHTALPGEEESGVHENTGGTAIFASPGLRFEANPWLALSTYVQFPLYQRVNGTQLVAPSQFWIGTTYKLP
jgi:hypothetical protein